MNKRNKLFFVTPEALTGQGNVTAAGDVTREAFGSGAHKTAELASAFALCLERQGVYSCMKHYLGHGAAAEDSHKGFAHTDKTREELGFDGVVITMPADFQEAYHGLLEAVRAGRIPEERIDVSVRRIVEKKMRLDYK